MGRPCGAARGRRARPALHRPALLPRSHQPAGFRRPARPGPASPPPGAYLLHARPQHPHARPGQAHRGPRVEGAGGRPRAQRGGIRADALRDDGSPQRHHPRGRAGTGPLAPRHDHRLRRLAHLHARRGGRRGLRRGNQRSGDGARVAVHPPAETPHDAHPHRGHAGPLRHGQGPGALPHAAAHDLRRHGLLRGICRQRGTRADDGRAPDPVQPLDRDGCPRRHGRPRRSDLRLPERQGICAPGRGLGPGGGLLADAAQRRRRGLRPGVLLRCRRHRPDDHLRHESRHGHARRRDDPAGGLFQGPAVHGLPAGRAAARQAGGLCVPGRLHERPYRRFPPFRRAGQGSPQGRRRDGLAGAGVVGSAPPNRGGRHRPHPRRRGL